MKSIKEIVGASTNDLKDSRVSSALKNMASVSEQNIQSKVVDFRNKRMKFDSLLDLGDDTTIDIASKIRGIDPVKFTADVNAAVDPTYENCFEPKNCSYINEGVVISKYTGARGKSGTSDASAEYMGEVRSMLESNNIIWQVGELGKVDLGGGGTIAKYVANMNIDVVDLGVPVLSMHAPFEIVSKVDVYMAYLAFLHFFMD